MALDGGGGFLIGSFLGGGGELSTVGVKGGGNVTAGAVTGGGGLQQSCGISVEGTPSCAAQENEVADPVEVTRPREDPQGSGAIPPWAAMAVYVKYVMPAAEESC